MLWVKKQATQRPASAAFLLGALCALGFAPLYWWPVAIVCLALFLNLVFFSPPAPKNHPSVKKAVLLGWVFGLGFSLAGLWWMGSSFRYTSLGGWAVAAAPFAMVLLAGVMGVWYGAVTGIAAALGRFAPPWVLPLIIAIVWAGMEALRALSVYGLPWHLFGYVFAGNTALMQPAAYGTVMLLSLMGVLLAAALARGPRPASLIYIVAVTGVFGAGACRLYTAPPLKELGQAAVYQTNLRQDLKWQTPAFELALTTFANLKKAPAEAELLVFPETVFTFLKQAEPNLPGLVDGHTPSGAGTVYGIPTFENGRYFNGMVSTSGDGSAAGQFNKKLLVPFGEFIPLKEFMPAFLKQFAPANAYSASANTRVIQTTAGRALPIICYEAIFPYHLLKAKGDSPGFILNLTNDGWFAGTTGPHQHFAIARMRSVETGLSQVRATNKGISAFIDGYGRVTKRLNVEQSGYLSGSIFEQINALQTR